MSRLVLRRHGSERGATLPLVALSMVALLGLTAFGTDLGWMFINSIRAQRAAEAAAMAGVVYMPDDLSQATTVARYVAGTNGYNHDADAIVTPALVPSEPYQLDVVVSRTVETFFLAALGIDEFTVIETARAEFLPPVPLGNRGNRFGNACSPSDAGCTGQSNFWANIHGRYTPSPWGDAYSSYCANGSGGSSSCTANPSFREGGYLYGIERGSNSSFTVSFLDMAHRNISGGVSTSDSFRTGDRGCEAWGDSSADCGQTVKATLYAPDATPLNVGDNTAICTHTWSPQPQVAANAPYTFEVPESCFTVAGASAGTYVLQIQVVSPADPTDSGLNRYALEVTSGSTIFGLGDFSIYNNASGTTTQFDIAEIDSVYRGKTLVVELWDPGDSKEAGQLSVIAPDGSPFDDGACRIYSRDSVNDSWSLQSQPATCVEHVSKNEYNGRWLRFEMDLPETYSCSTCWWQMNYSYSSGVTDTTTWRAFVSGNPIHLIPTD